MVKLRRKVKKLEEGIETSRLGDVTLCPKEIQTLKEQLSTAENNSQILKEQFRSYIHQFRDTVYMLLGYKIDKMSGSSEYRLTNMYAESSEDYIRIQVNSEEALNVLENNFSKSLEDMIDLHLRRQKSFPVFLSELTIKLFNDRSMAT